MEKQPTLTQGEWPVMELLWQRPHTLMELVAELGQSIGWSKSTVSTMVRRMTDKGLIRFEASDRAKIFYPAISREAVGTREAHSILHRAYNGSIGLLVSSLVRQDGLTQADIDELYAILKEAEGNAK